MNLLTATVVRANRTMGTDVYIMYKTSIKANAIVGAGAVVSKPIRENRTAFCILARPIKFHVI